MSDLDREKRSSGKAEIAATIGVMVGGVLIVANQAMVPMVGVATGNIGMMAFGIIGVHNYLNYYHEMEKNIGNYKNKKQFKIKKGEHLKQLQKCKQEKKKK
eukprot:499591_1